MAVWAALFVLLGTTLVAVRAGSVIDDDGIGSNLHTSEVVQQLLARASQGPPDFDHDQHPSVEGSDGHNQDDQLNAWQRTALTRLKAWTAAQKKSSGAKDGAVEGRDEDVDATEVELTEVQRHHETAQALRRNPMRQVRNWVDAATASQFWGLRPLPKLTVEVPIVVVPVGLQLSSEVVQHWLSHLSHHVPHMHFNMANATMQESPVIDYRFVHTLACPLACTPFFCVVSSLSGCLFPACGFVVRACTRYRSSVLMPGSGLLEVLNTFIQFNTRLDGVDEDGRSVGYAEAVAVEALLHSFAQHMSQHFVIPKQASWVFLMHLRPDWKQAGRSANNTFDVYGYRHGFSDTELIAALKSPLLRTRSKFVAQVCLHDVHPGSAAPQPLCGLCFVAGGVVLGVMVACAVFCAVCACAVIDARA